jgi:ABC-type phosphate/phosphonate transport system substrate-binding protein
MPVPHQCVGPAPCKRAPIASRAGRILVDIFLKLFQMSHFDIRIPLSLYYRNILLWCLGSVLLASGAVAQTAVPVKYSFSVVPQFSAIELHKNWTPFLARLSKDTGFTLELKIMTSIPLFEASFQKGEPDFAYVNPYHAVMARKAQAYAPLLRDSKPLMGVLVVRKDSGIKTLKDLNGQKIESPRFSWRLNS